MFTTIFTTRIFTALALCGGLAACGNSVGEQAIYGGAIGAGAAAVVGGDVGAGAVIGVAGNLLYCQAYPSRCN